MKYVPEKGKYFDADFIPEGLKGVSISGTEVRRRLLTGKTFLTGSVILQ